MSPQAKQFAQEICRDMAAGNRPDSYVVESMVDHLGGNRYMAQVYLQNNDWITLFVYVACLAIASE